MLTTLFNQSLPSLAGMGWQYEDDYPYQVLCRMDSLINPLRFEFIVSEEEGDATSSKTGRTIRHGSVDLSQVGWDADRNTLDALLEDAGYEGFIDFVQESNGRPPEMAGWGGHTKLDNNPDFFLDLKFLAKTIVEGMPPLGGDDYAGCLRMLGIAAGAQESQAKCGSEVANDLRDGSMPEDCPCLVCRTPSCAFCPHSIIDPATKSVNENCLPGSPLSKERDEAIERLFLEVDFVAWDETDTDMVLGQPFRGFPVGKFSQNDWFNFIDRYHSKGVARMVNGFRQHR